MLGYLLALTVPLTAFALLYARWEYRRKGKLTLLGVFLLCAMILLPNLILHYEMTYSMPSTWLDYVGLLTGVVGVGLCVFGIVAFKSLSKMFCLDVGQLTEVGPYRWSRNPQLVGFFLFLLGFALQDWSLWCLAAMLVVVIYIHLMVLIEEEHLRRVFGEQYVEFCRRTPRYLGWSGRSKTSPQSTGL